MYLFYTVIIQLMFQMPVRTLVLPFYGDMCQLDFEKRFEMFCVGRSSVENCWLYLELEGVDQDSAYHFHLVGIEEARHRRMLSHTMRMPWTRALKCRNPQMERCLSYGCVGDRILIISNSVRYHLREGGRVYDGSIRGWDLTPGKYNFNMWYSERYGWIMQELTKDGPTRVFGALFTSGGYFTQTLLCQLGVEEQNYYAMFSDDDLIWFVQHLPGEGCPGYTMDLLLGYQVSIWIYSISSSSFRQYRFDGEFCFYFWRASFEQCCHFYCHNGRLVMLTRQHCGDGLFYCYHVYYVELDDENLLWRIGDCYFTWPLNGGYSDSELDWNFDLISKEISILVIHDRGSFLVFKSEPCVSVPSLWTSARSALLSVSDAYSTLSFGGSYVSLLLDSVQRLLV